MVTLFLIVAYPADLILSYGLNRSHGHPAEFEVWRDIYNGSIDTEIEIIGSSRAWVNINPLILEDSSQKISVRIIEHQPTTRLLEKFVADCKVQGIRLFFAYPPEYSEGQGFVENREEIITKQQDIARSGGEFLDYSSREISRRQELFYNTQHLNYIGASVFTTQLAHDLKQILAKPN